MARYSMLADHLRQSLLKIEPSRSGFFDYYPCGIRLRDGRASEYVYVCAESKYEKLWLPWPEVGRGKRSIKVEDVVEIWESRTRLPARFANELNRSGETGMGIMTFEVEFADGYKLGFGGGEAVDFINYPIGYGPEDVVSVHTVSRGRPDLIPMPNYSWCLYSENE